MGKEKTILSVNANRIILYTNTFRYLGYSTEADTITIEPESSDKAKIEIDNENKIIKIEALSEMGSIDLTIKAQKEDKEESQINVHIEIIKWVIPHGYQEPLSRDQILKKYSSEQWLKEIKSLLEENREMYDRTELIETISFFSFRYKEKIITKMFFGAKYGKIFRTTVDEYDNTIEEELFIPLLPSRIQGDDKYYYNGEKCDIISILSMYKRDWDYVFIT